MRYLVTGGAGFIGSSLVDKLLSLGHSVVVVDNFDNYYDIKIKKSNIAAHKKNKNYRLYKVNIENIKNLMSIFKRHHFDAVIHLAARAGVRPSLERPIDYVKTNILGTVNILECMHKYDVKKLIFASSSSVYGNCKEKSFSEDLKVTEPISPYAATKSACEQLCYTWHHLYGIDVVVLRFFTVYGPRQRPDLAIHKFANKIIKSLPIQMYGDGTTKRDYTYIDDIVNGICAAINYNKTGYEIINLGGGEPITLKRMIQTIEQEIGCKAIIEQKPLQPGDVDKTVCDWSKAYNLLKYTPKTKFADGVKKFIKWKNKNETI